LKGKFKIGPAGTAVMTFAGIFGFASLAQADITNQSRFLGTLFWPGFNVNVSI